MQAPGGHRGHSLQPVTAVPGCEGFPARALSLIFLSRLSQWGWGGGEKEKKIAFSSAGSGALTSVMMCSAPWSRTQMEER